MVEINITRNKRDILATTGTLELKIDGETKFSCVTLENPREGEAANQDLCIPEGVYNMEFRHSPKYSPKLGCDVILIHNDIVSKDRLILFHHGNYSKDTLGCILLGTDIAPSEEHGRMITSSLNKTKEFYKILNNISLEDSKLTIKNKF